MKKENLFGYVPAIATPFNKKGEIMEDAFVDLFEFLIERGATCVCIAGDNGESWSLSAEERGRLVRVAKDTSRGRVPIMMGISAPQLMLHYPTLEPRKKTAQMCCYLCRKPTS